MEDIDQLIYISSATNPMSEDELLPMLEKARIKNQSLNISGMLVYNDGAFIQVLEGPPEAVTTLYQTITEDSRHKNCITLLRQKIPVRAFEGWFMAFRSTNPKEVEEIIGYIDFFGNNPVPHHGAAAYRLLTNFRNNLNRQPIS